MAVAVDTTTQSAFQNSAAHNSQSAIHTAGGASRYVVAILPYRGASEPSSVTATYDAVSMSELVRVRNGVSGVIIFGLNNPSTTTDATVAMSWTNDASWSQMTVISFTGVGGGVGDTKSSGSTSAQTTAITLTPIGADDFAVDGFASSGGNAANDPTVGADQTIRGLVQSEAGFKCGCSTQDGVSGGGLEWDNIETDQVNHAGVVLLSVSASTTFTRSFSDTTTVTDTLTIARSLVITLLNISDTTTVTDSSHFGKPTTKLFVTIEIT